MSEHKMKNGHVENDISRNDFERVFDLYMAEMRREIGQNEKAHLVFNDFLIFISAELDRRANAIWMTEQDQTL